jgi:hypothetical protein
MVTCHLFLTAMASGWAALEEVSDPISVFINQGGANTNVAPLVELALRVGVSGLQPVAPPRLRLTSLTTDPGTIRPWRLDGGMTAQER